MIKNGWLNNKKNKIWNSMTIYSKKIMEVSINNKKANHIYIYKIITK